MDWQPLSTGGTRLFLNGDGSREHRDFLREEIGRGWFSFDFDFQVERPKLLFDLHQIADVTLASGFHTAHRAMAVDNGDDDHDWMGLAWAHGSPCRFEWRGREIEVGDGEAFLCDSREPFFADIPATVGPRTLRFPRHFLIDGLRDGKDCLMRPIRAETPALRLLESYFDRLIESGAASDRELADKVAAHLSDLTLLCLGARRDEGSRAWRRGGTAARRVMVERWVESHLTSPRCLIGEAAKTFRCSERTIQRLFKADARCFSDFVRERRLERARQQLSSAALDDRTIAEIAYGVGFNDLSHFNHCYRDQFGETPGDTRDNMSSMPSDEGSIP